MTPEKSVKEIRDDTLKDLRNGIMFNLLELENSGIDNDKVFDLLEDINKFIKEKVEEIAGEDQRTEANIDITLAGMMYYSRLHAYGKLIEEFSKEKGIDSSVLEQEWDIERDKRIEMHIKKGKDN